MDWDFLAEKQADCCHLSDPSTTEVPLEYVAGAAPTPLTDLEAIDPTSPPISALGTQKAPWTCFCGGMHFESERLQAAIDQTPHREKSHLWCDKCLMKGALKVGIYLRRFINESIRCVWKGYTLCLECQSDPLMSRVFVLRIWTALVLWYLLNVMCRFGNDYLAYEPERNIFITIMVAVASTAAVLSSIIVLRRLHLKADSYLARMTASLSGHLLKRVTPDPVELSQRVSSNNRQLFANLSIVGLESAYALIVAGVIFYPGGIGDLTASWLASCVVDAQFLSDFSATDTPASPLMAFLIKCVLTLVLWLYLWPVFHKVASFLATFALKLNQTPGGLSIHDSFFGTLSAKRRCMVLALDRPWLHNMARTFWWLCFCYGILFTTIAFCPGAVGDNITSWISCSLLDANVQPPIYPIKPPTSDYYQLHAPLPTQQHSLVESNFHAIGMQMMNLKWQDWGVSNTSMANIRIFIASIVALYGSVPLAVSASVFLPYRKRPELMICDETILFPDGMRLALNFRPLRYWEDLKAVELKGKESKKNKRQLRLTFHSGGGAKLRLKQLLDEDLDELLTAIDEHAANCRIDPKVIQLRQDTSERLKSDRFGGNRKIEDARAHRYSSTIFVAHAPGTTLKDGAIRIIRQLASKPLCSVYLARLSCNKLAVLKQFVIPSDTQENLRLKNIFQRECELLQTLDHPQIVKVMDAFEEGGSNYLHLEYVKGTDLFSLIKDKGPRDERTLLAWARYLCEIMTYLHSRPVPVLHRDLTPDNIILDENGKLRLVDFGAAHQFLEGITGTIVGKQAYVPPEQLRGKPTPRSDIYSFGATLYFLSTGNEPRALLPCDALSQSARISRELNELILRCTAFEESDRPQSFEEIRSLLGATT